MMINRKGRRDVTSLPFCISFTLWKPNANVSEMAYATQCLDTVE
uniref:Uncharacterized protein n=1 Tax=Anguilla anguilla TaxID=7936 RepID=A0A0E9T5J5_ANGAN